jgi:hypothetical protein
LISEKKKKLLSSKSAYVKIASPQESSRLVWVILVWLFTSSLWKGRLST